MIKYISLLWMILLSAGGSCLYAAESMPSSAPSPSPTNMGSISGALGFPSEAIPPLLVVAFQNEDRGKFQKMETAKNQSTFIIPNLKPGAYVVVAYPLSNDPLKGGYTKAVACGLLASCTDHSLIPVAVEAGKVSKGVNLTDWYAPDSAFPPKP